MFDFLRTSSKGRIEREFKWLSLRRIVSDLQVGSLTPATAATGLFRLSIYGGLDLKKSLNKHKLLKNADPDRLVVEGVAFTWVHIYRACLNSQNCNIYADDELTEAVYSGAKILHNILDRFTDFDLETNYIVPYSNGDLITSTETLTSRLLTAGHVEMLGDLQDNIGVALVTRIYAAAMLPGIIEAGINLLRIYLSPDEYRNKT